MTEVAVIDTGFCPESIDMTDSVKINCRNIALKDLEASPRFHGHWVLSVFHHHLGDKKSGIKIHPLIVFNDKGEQTKAAWIKALEYIKQKKIPFVLSASGFPTNDILTASLPGIWFVAAGRVERKIINETVLFPQMLAPQKNLFLIGDYQQDSKNASVFYDQALKYQEKIDYYFPSKGVSPNVFGTSSAVAEALGKAFRICTTQMKNVEYLRACLKKNQKILKDNILKKEMATF